MQSMDWLVLLLNVVVPFTNIRIKIAMVDLDVPAGHQHTLRTCLIRHRTKCIAQPSALCCQCIMCFVVL